MAKIQDVDIPYLEFAEAAAPGTPASGIVRTYSKADGLMYSKDDAGTETLMSGGGGGATVATESTAASGDTTIVNTATFYDGVSESFAAGTWLVGGTLTVGVIVSTSQNYVWSWRLWDGTNIFMEGEFGPTTTGNLNGQFYSLPVGVMIVTLGSTTTLKISVSCIRGSSASAIKRNIGLNSGTSNKATQITGYKVT